ncbi:nuclear transport factor 2 family protein [Bradyrhizobium sp. 182]|uniref:nuclear transport factor 2 family protein n=1 Tax=unclassified Bradyrhizobium TaxID=2631580 RepID=UPI001FF8DD71|nr:MULTISPECIES: nuclear transport factor 2 family protein [unclassified Bradyrhizobium]MCK1422349.1 nuclear transport factor 2 family protein [Bradyrhizobium sp. CW12]MCK1527862.1 nuclear transport factor 2 family protein [Bradyrhizobium sp. 182]MCK1649105.1 nuclear transport factor 2 family protein [Bradyrhizobium sp. 154]
MSSEANVQLLKEAYRQWNDSKGQSVDYWFDNVIGPQIKFDSIPRGAEPIPFARRYDDRTELRSYFDGLLADWSMEYYTMNEYVAQGDAVVARGECAWTNKKTGKVAQTPKVDFWRFKDGKAVEYHEFFDTACVAAAAT